MENDPSVLSEGLDEQELLWLLSYTAGALSRARAPTPGQLEDDRRMADRALRLAREVLAGRWKKVK